jgi:esterase/lipase
MMMRCARISLLLAFVGVVANVADTRAETIGVVLLHGKQGAPAQLQPLGDTIGEAGFLIVSPEMCWSRKRIYDRTYLDCLADVDQAITQIEARGATSIVILGMSLGGNAALAYGARHQGLKGVIALAPAHAVEFLRKNHRIAQSVAQAEAMVATGKGDERAAFADINDGIDLQVNTTANIYLSFFGRNSPAMMSDNAERLTAPLLAVSGRDDPTQRSIPYVFARAPDNPLNQRIVVSADHRGTPGAAAKVVVNWLRALEPK